MIYYAIKYHKDRNTISIHIDVPILERAENGSTHPHSECIGCDLFDEDSDGYEDYKDNKISEKLEEYLLKIEGVARIKPKRYELIITKGEIFRWKEVIPAVLRLIIFEFGDKDECAKEVRLSTESGKKRNKNKKEVTLHSVKLIPNKKSQ